MTSPQPPTFDEMANLAQHPGFRDRVRVAMVTAAIAVGAEANDGSETSRVRRAHSQNVLKDQESWSAQYAWAVAASPDIAFNALDSVIQDVVTTRFSAMAGAPPITPPA
jgi:hypothetical protein